MKTLMAFTLLLFGAVVLLEAMLAPLHRNSAMSDAAHLEANLKDWAIEKVSEGKLDESDVDEIFSGHSLLRFGGENPDKNFRKMIVDISRASEPSRWPGAIAIVVGLIGAVSSVRSSRNKRAEQDMGLDAG